MSGRSTNEFADLWSQVKERIQQGRPDGISEQITSVPEANRNQCTQFLLTKYIENCTEVAFVETLYILADGHHKHVDNCLLEILRQYPNLKIDRYQMSRILSDTNNSIVFEAFHVSLNKKCVLKLVGNDAQRNLQKIDAAQNEAVTLSRVQSIYVPQIYDCFAFRGFYCLILEFIHGETVESIVKREQHFSSYAFVRVALECLYGLRSIHEAGYVHRDIKPANIIRDDKFHPKIIDFGIAMAIGQSINESGISQFVETQSSLPSKPPEPENLPPYDIYGLGVTFYYMLSGRNVQNFPRTHNNPITPPLSDAHVHSKQLNDIVLSMISFGPTQRPTIETLIENFTELVLLFERDSNPEFCEIYAPSGRGHVNDNIVDATLCFDTGGLPLERDIKKQIESGDILDCAYSYSVDHGASHWIDLCDEEDYVAYWDSYNLLLKKADEIIDSFPEELLNQSPDVISIGPGNGHNDRLLLRAVYRAVEKYSGDHLYYYPMDVSLMLLSKTVHHVSKKWQFADKSRETLRIKVCEGNFRRIANFRDVFNHRPGPNVFFFLGNTLGNVSEEVKVLNGIKNAMKIGDILLLEVRLQSVLAEPGGKPSTQYALSFAPLKRLGIEYDSDYINVWRSKFSQIEETVSDIVTYRKATIEGKLYKDIKLSCINYYKEASIVSTLSSIGLELIQTFKTDHEILAMFVLRRVN